MSEVQTISRREFLWRSALFSTGLALANLQTKAFSVLGANDRVRVGIIGLGARGCRHIDHYLSLPNVEIAAVCDLQANSLHKTAANLQKVGSKSLVRETDYRRILDMPDLDAVSIAVPRKLRTALAIDSIQSGKNVLIEKPFSATVGEGKRLAAAVNKHRRIVQQRDENFFVPETDLSGAGAFQIIGGITQVKSCKTIFPHRQKLQKFNENEESVLPELALDEFDVARCFLGVGAPTKVSAMGFSHKIVNPLSKIMTQLEFSDEKGEKRRIHLEVRTSLKKSSDSRDHILSVEPFSANGAAYFESQSELVGKSGKLSIRCDSLEGRSTSKINFANFIDCVRENDPKGLINPFDEARKSNLLLQLTELSLRFERGFDFDPIQEKVVGDAEINNHL